MKAGQTEQRGSGFPPVCKHQHGCGQQRAKGRIVPQQMVIFAPPLQGPAAVSGQKISNDAKTVRVRGKAADSDQQPLAAVKLDSVGGQPAEKQMRDWTHGGMEKYFEEMPKM